VVGLTRATTVFASWARYLSIQLNEYLSLLLPVCGRLKRHSVPRRPVRHQQAAQHEMPDLGNEIEMLQVPSSGNVIA